MSNLEQHKYEIPPQPQPKKELPKDPEVLRNEIEQLGKWVDALFKIDTDRSGRRYPLTPYFTLQPGKLRYDYDIKELYPHEPAEGTELKPEHLREMQNKTLGLLMEVAAQIVEYHAPRVGGATEDTESLRTLLQVLSRGEGLRQKIEESRPEDVREVIQKLLLHRKHSPFSERLFTDKEKISDDDIKAFSGVIEAASRRLTKALKALEEYLGR